MVGCVGVKALPLAFSLVCCWTTTAIAQPAETLTFAPVSVLGLAQPATASYAKLLRGVSAAQSHRHLAPGASLAFRLIDQSNSVASLRLHLEMQDRTIALAVDSDGFFSLPTPEVAGAAVGDVVANRPAGTVVIDPIISTPGYPAQVARMGDRRLWCEVVFAIDKDDLPPTVKELTAAGYGPCTSPRIKIYSIARGAPLQKAELIEGTRHLSLTIHVPSNGFVVPMHDQSWSNEALLRITYANPGH